MNWTAERRSGRHQVCPPSLDAQNCMSIVWLVEWNTGSQPTNAFAAWMVEIDDITWNPGGSRQSGERAKVAVDHSFPLLLFACIVEGGQRNDRQGRKMKRKQKDPKNRNPPMAKKKHNCEHNCESKNVVLTAHIQQRSNVHCPRQCHTAQNRQVGLQKGSRASAMPGTSHRQAC